MDSVCIILLISLLAVSASPGCDQDVIKVCDFEMTSGNKYPKGVSELDKQCSEDEPKFACFTDFVDKCPSVVKKELTDFFVASKKLINRMCGGDLRKKYLRNAKCFSDVMTSKHSVCAETNKDKITDGGGVCVHTAAVEECIGPFVKNSCGQEAYEFLLELHKVARLAIVNEKCH